PPRPPLPVPRSFPFQLEATGIHNSILILESLEGFNVAWTRQKPGRSLNCCPRAPAGAAAGAATGGGVNAPAPTLCARVIVVFGIGNLARSSQRVAAKLFGPQKNQTASTATPTGSLLDGIICSTSECDGIYPSRARPVKAGSIRSVD